MSSPVKFLIGLAAVIVAAWFYHGPLGFGATYIGGIEDRARAVVAGTDIADVEVRLGHAPLSRAATMSGDADAFQREGQGELKGLNDLVAEIEGVSDVRWADDPASQQGFVLPLLLELIILAGLAYLLGLGIAWFIWGRKRREGFY